jgi:hypothetical protein
MDIMLERILLSIPKRYGAKKCKNGHEFGHKKYPPPAFNRWGLLYLPSSRSMRSSMALTMYSFSVSPNASAAACISTLRPLGSVSSFTSLFSFIHWFLYSVRFPIKSPCTIIPYSRRLIYGNNIQSILYKIGYSAYCNVSYIRLY